MENIFSDDKILEIFRFHMDVNSDDFYYAWGFQNPPRWLSIVVLGIFGSFFMKYFLIGVTSSVSYIVQVKMGGEKKSFRRIERHEIKKTSVKNFAIEKLIIIKLKDGSKYHIHCPVTARGIKKQEKNLAKISEIFSTLS